MSVSFLAKLLAHYGLSDDAYGRLTEAPSLAKLPSIAGDENVQKAIARLAKAKAEKENVLIYGDYDTDGVMSASILLRSFRSYGLNVAGYLPSRYLDGYGLTSANVEAIAQKGFTLIVTCDNGVTAHEALKKAQSLGVDVIVLDHHEFDEVPPECLVLVHEANLNLGVHISAGLLSYFFATALLGQNDDYLLTLGALSTISDVMPLSGVNREAVKLGLERLNRYHYPPFSYLSERTLYDEKVLQMEIVPKINAVGRLLQGKEINRLLTYFASPNGPEEVALAGWLNETNTRRKELTRTAEEGLSLDPSEAAIVVLTDTPEGLNGLLASRLLEEYGKPVCVFSPALKDETLLVGSVRSDEGFNVLKALEATKAPLVSKGGHAFAGGVAIKKEDFALFKKDFLYSALKHQLERKKEELIPLTLEECTMENYRLVASIGPYGAGFPAPKFLLEGLDPTRFQYIKDGKFLSTSLNAQVRLFSFSINSASFPTPDKCALAVSFALHEWKGRITLDLLAEKPE
jgi:single-stranded-DNA-specific exonuclease